MVSILLAFKNPAGVPSAVPIEPMLGWNVRRADQLVPMLQIVDGLLALALSVREAVPPAETETYGQPK